MDVFSNLATGFHAAASLQNLGFALTGCVLGTLIGVLPGIGPIPTIAMLLPITFGLDPLSSLIMLAGIYYGAQYGGSTTSILVNMPGEASSVVTCIDGHQMARQGRAGAALSVAALGSFFAGCVGTVFIAAFGPPLAAFAQKFNSPDYFSLMLLGLLMAVMLAHGSVIKAIAMVVVGLLFGLVGTDVNTGSVRYTFGVSELWDGIDFLPMVIGMFGIVEIIRNLEGKEVDRIAISTKFRDLWPSARDFAQSWKPVLRGTGVGAILGILPGGGAVLASFAAYTIEKKVADDPKRFGKGAIEGVAGPESANNAAAQTSFIPLLTLGLPSNPIMALMMGAMMIQGIQPGSAVMTSRPDLFWGTVASMWIGNLMLVIINLPMIGIWVKLLSIPYRFLFPAILLFCVIGVYSTNASWVLMVMTVVFAAFGYIMVRFGCEPAPMVLGFLLGPLMEENLRRSLVLSRGDPLIFVERPISLVLLICAGLLLLLIILPYVRKSRDLAFEEDGG
jgi:putative tricarboxylic transport membrane protein